MDSRTKESHYFMKDDNSSLRSLWVNVRACYSNLLAQIMSLWLLVGNERRAESEEKRRWGDNAALPLWLPVSMHYPSLPAPTHTPTQTNSLSFKQLLSQWVSEYLRSAVRPEICMDIMRDSIGLPGKWPNPLPSYNGDIAIPVLLSQKALRPSIMEKSRKNFIQMVEFLAIIKFANFRIIFNVFSIRAFLISGHALYSWHCFSLYWKHREVTSPWILPCYNSYKRKSSNRLGRGFSSFRTRFISLRIRFFSRNHSCQPLNKELIL